MNSRAENTEITRKNTYITDNLARQVAEPMQRPQEQTRPGRARKVAEQSAPLIGIRKRMGFFACVISLAALAFIAWTVIGYSNARAKIINLDKEITALNNEYANLYRTNDEREQLIADSIDLTHVYEVAVGQYGMVYPRDNETIRFTYRDDGYVRQYSAVAEEVKPEETVWESILRKIVR